MMSGRKNEKEFESLFREMYSRLCLYAESIVCDDDVAKDIVQQVFMQLWMKVDSYDWTRELQAYLFRSVYNASMNVIRHERVRHSFLEFVQRQESYEEGENPLLFEHDDREQLIRRMNELRWVLIIIFFEILIPPEPFMRDAPHFFYRKYNKNLL